jgi:hypothetical protein
VGSAGPLIANTQENQSENGTIKQSTHTGGNGGPPKRTPVRLEPTE